MVAAGKKHPGLAFEVEWLPFQLQPDLSRSSGACASPPANEDEEDSDDAAY